MKKTLTLSPFLKGSTGNIVKGEGLRAFTLIEILISLTIFSMIMVSVMMIYVTASDLTKKYEINREMRNSIKSVVEDIAEEVRKNEIEGVARDYSLGGTNFDFATGTGTRLKLKNGIEYRLVEYKKGYGKKYSDITNEGLDGNSNKNCQLVNDMCRIVKFDKNGEVGPLTNSKVSFTNLEFAVSGSGSVPKVTLNFVARASVREGIRPKLAEKTKLIFQTTISERVLKVK